VYKLEVSKNGQYRYLTTTIY